MFNGSPIYLPEEGEVKFSTSEWSIDELHKIRTLRNSSIRVMARHARSASRKRGSPATHNFGGQWRESRRSNRSAKMPRNVRGPRLDRHVNAYNSPNETPQFSREQRRLGKNLNGLGRYRIARTRFRKKKKNCHYFLSDIRRVFYTFRNTGSNY